MSAGCDTLKKGLVSIRNAQWNLSSLAFLFNEERKFKAQQTNRIFIRLILALNRMCC